MSEEKKNIWRIFLKAAGIRALKTFFQSLAALIPIGVSITEVGWPQVLGTALLAAILSMCTSLGGIPEAVSPLKETEKE